MADNEPGAEPSAQSSTRPDQKAADTGETAGARDVEVVDGDAVVPDADQAPDREDLKPEDPPAGMPAEGDPAKKTAVAPPVPAHGEMASREQIEEATRAAEEEDEQA